MDTEKQQSILGSLEEAYGTFGSPKQKNLCERFFPKKMSQNTLASVAVLKAFLKAPTIQSRKELEEYPFETNEGEEKMIDESCMDGNFIKKSLLNDALKVLRCSKLIRLDKRSYSINWNLWHEDVRYKITNEKIFFPLVPMMVSYLRNDVKFTPNNFIESLDPLVAHIFLPSSRHNHTYEQEKKVYRAMENGDMVRIKLSDGSLIDVDPIAIKMEDNKKLVEYEDEDGKKYTAPLSSVEV